MTRTMKIKAVCLFICIAVFMYSCATIISIARANVDEGRSASLNLTYSNSEKCFSGINIKIYRVADMRLNTYFTLSGDFADLPVDVNAVKSQSEWRQIALTLSSYITSESIDTTASVYTDENGVASFKPLKTGLYLVSGVTIEVENGYYVFDDFMITLPGIDTDSEWLYDVDAKPKFIFEEKTVEDEKYTVRKLWKDDGSEGQRPSSVDIEIYKDSALYSTVNLSSDNNWSYTWTTSHGHSWHIVEKDVSEKYTVAVSQSNNVFYVSNSTGDPPPPPQTGDTVSIYIAVAVMSILGAGLIVFGMAKRRGIE